MRKKIPLSGGPACPPDTDVALGCGAVTPEMQGISDSVESNQSVSRAETEKFLRDAVGRLFIAVLEQIYEQRYGKKPQ
jgi:hypothetical protein